MEKLIQKYKARIKVIDAEINNYKMILDNNPSMNKSMANVLRRRYPTEKQLYVHINNVLRKLQEANKVYNRKLYEYIENISSDADRLFRQNNSKCRGYIYSNSKSKVFNGGKVSPR